jgi:hypothetical protein
MVRAGRTRTCRSRSRSSARPARCPGEWIVDETRSLGDFTGFDSVEEGVLAYLPGVRLDPRDRAAPLILTESRSLAGVLRELVRDYRAQITATNGQCGGFLRTGIAPVLQEGGRVLYLGDLDLAGGHIEANTRAVLEREVGALAWERLALTEEQVEDYALPRITKRDHRYKDGRPHDAVETEALSQAVLVEVLRTRLDELLPEPLDNSRRLLSF